jgi:hypothetical protein
MRPVLATFAVFSACVTAIAVGFSGASLAAGDAISVNGTIVLKPIAIKSCKSVTGLLKGESVTQIQCTDTGTLNGKPRRGGVGSGWLWTLHKKKLTEEAANLGVNFGNGVADFTLIGSVKVIGKSTTQSGHAITTGTWKMKHGTGAYKGLTGTGSYTFAIRRTSTRYISLTMTLRGSLR